MAGGPRFIDEHPEGTGAAFTHVTQDAQPEEAPASALPRGPMLLEPERDAPDRLQVDWKPGVIAAPRPTRSTAIWMICGVGVLFAGWIGLSSTVLVLGLLRWSEALGILGGVAIGAGIGLIGYGVALEWRAYRSLASTERLRAILGGTELSIERARAASIDWARGVAASASVDIEALERGLRAANTLAELRALLRARLLDKLRAASLQIGRQSAMEGATVVAICPHPALDGLAVSLRSLVMVRQIATLYGVRPGMLATIALMGRVASASAMTSAIDLVSQGLADHLLSNMPVVKHIAAAIPGASASALRIYRLAETTAEACCPIRTE